MYGSALHNNHSLVADHRYPSSGSHWDLSFRHLEERATRGEGPEIDDWAFQSLLEGPPTDDRAAAARTVIRVYAKLLWWRQVAATPK
jgi:hypothetical protein